MTVLLPWLRVLLAVGVFVGVAALASIATRAIGQNLRDMEGRTSTTIALIGLVGNVAVLGVVLVMLTELDGRALGLGITPRDGVVLAGFVAVTAASAAVFLAIGQRRGWVHVQRRTDQGAQRQWAGAWLIVLVLAIVVLQEEVLFRGYITVNLEQFGWVVVAAASTVLFTAVHLLTNRVSSYQVASWAVGGAVLVMAYLVSGSFWVPVVLHLAMDLTNVVAFGIVGRYSLVTIKPPLDERARSLYRAVSSLIVAALLWGAYGAQVNLAVADQRPVGQQGGIQEVVRPVGIREVLGTVSSTAAGPRTDQTVEARGDHTQAG